MGVDDDGSAEPPPLEGSEDGADELPVGVSVDVPVGSDDGEVVVSPEDPDPDDPDEGGVVPDGRPVDVLDEGAGRSSRAGGAVPGPASRTVTGGPTGVPTDPTTAGTPASGGAAGSGCCSARRSRSATVGVIVVDDPAPVGTRPAPQGSGVSTSAASEGRLTVVEDCVIVW